MDITQAQDISKLVYKHGVSCNATDLEVLYRIGGDSECTTIRWCKKCGGISIDIDFDGRTNAGYVMPMKFPIGIIPEREIRK